ncbi:Pre-rRNA-processing protein TSR2-domain-containing protein [Amylostereum chailletii]|nr:Pre-rRNA-processing protein TSR2-domain-containing protein [Amylostereum chailletii]
MATPSTSTLTAPAPAPPNPISVLFARGVLARLHLWPALRAAVDNAWGGPASAQKRTWLASVLVDAFEGADGPPPDAEYVALTLLQALEDEFDAVLEDGSAEEVGRDVVLLWEAACGGEEATIRGWEARAEGVRGRKVVVEVVDDNEEWEDEEEGSEGSEEEEEVPTLVEGSRGASEPVVDEDGFTLVQSKSKGRR